MTDDAGDLALAGVLPVAKALAHEEIPTAQCAERHCFPIVRRGPDGARSCILSSKRRTVRRFAPKAGRPVPVERDDSLIELCRQAVERLASRLPDAQLYCHMRVGDALRVVASEGRLRMIYEVKQSQGGICWRAVETGESQLVEDVRSDPDYMATDERVRAEIAVPVSLDDEIVVVLDAEFADRSYTADEAEAMELEAGALARELARVLEPGSG
jgi:GAF domain-containing protein